jgi:hypothetical protein
MTTAASTSEVLYKKLESAFHAFQLELGVSTTDAQRRVFEGTQESLLAGRAIGVSPLEQQGKIAELWKEVDLPKRQLKALKEYKSAVVSAVANVDIHVLNAQALVSLARSYHHIALYGFWLNDPSVLGVSEKGDKGDKGAAPIEPDPSRKSSSPGASPTK